MAIENSRVRCRRTVYIMKCSVFMYICVSCHKHKGRGEESRNIKNEERRPIHHTPHTTHTVQNSV